MKFTASFLMVMFLALSGFTWGSSDSEKKVTNDAYNTASSAVATASTSMKKNSSFSSSADSYSAPSTTAQSNYAPAASKDQRANAIRILTAGDDATRKARIESLTRIAKSLAAAKQAKAGQATTARESTY
jgi:hypothetical protein